MYIKDLAQVKIRSIRLHLVNVNSDKPCDANICECSQIVPEIIYWWGKLVCEQRCNVGLYLSIFVLALELWNGSLPVVLCLRCLLTRVYKQKHKITSINIYDK